jgi:hypothetical protein
MCNGANITKWSEIGRSPQCVRCSCLRWSPSCLFKFRFVGCLD